MDDMGEFSYLEGRRRDFFYLEGRQGGFSLLEGLPGGFSTVGDSQTGNFSLYER